MNVVVTGGCGGLGSALVRRFVARGHRVVYTFRHEDCRPVPTCVGPSLGVRCDVGNAADVEQLFNDACAFFRQEPVHVVINNAAQSGGYSALLDIEPDAIDDIVRTNLLGAMLCTRRALETFAQQKWQGHVVNVTGAGGDGRPTPMFTTYGATKAGVEQFTKSVRQERSSDGGGLHILSPGMMPTKLLQQGLPPAVRWATGLFAEDPNVVAAWAESEIVQTVALGTRRDVEMRFATPRRVLFKLANIVARTLKLKAQD